MDYTHAETREGSVFSTPANNSRHFFNERPLGEMFPDQAWEMPTTVSEQGKLASFVACERLTISSIPHNKRVWA